MIFGEKLRMLRQERGLTQPQLAEQLGIEQSWLSKVENDKCAPSEELLETVAQYFGIGLPEFLADLDTAFLRKQMRTIPAVKAFLNESQVRQFQSRRRWLLWSATACVVGAGIWYSGFMGYLAPNTLYEYKSEGVLYRGEPIELFSTSRIERLAGDFGLVPPRAYVTINDDKVFEERQHERLASYAELRRRVEARRVPEIILLSNYRGESYTMPAMVPENSVDIFGDLATTAIRNFNLQNQIADEAELNRYLQILGLMLVLCGLFGFLVDFRLSRIR